MTFKPRKTCEAVTSFNRGGRQYMAICSRFKGHEKATPKAPKHFDESKNYSWED